MVQVRLDASKLALPPVHLCPHLLCLLIQCLQGTERSAPLARQVAICSSRHAPASCRTASASRAGARGPPSPCGCPAAWHLSAASWQACILKADISSPSRSGPAMRAPACGRQGSLCGPATLHTASTVRCSCLPALAMLRLHVLGGGGLGEEQQPQRHGRAHAAQSSCCGRGR